VPKEYYEYLQTRRSREDLFRKYSSEAAKAALQAWHAELGVTPDQEVDDRIEEAIDFKEDWVLIGGPPCQGYSVIGRARNSENPNYCLRKGKRQTFYVKSLLSKITFKKIGPSFNLW
jgi:DNA (cytosine-5)-methyltransferase 1